MTFTPIQQVSSRLWAKRDDTFKYASVCGGKVKACLWLARFALKQGHTGLVTACNIHSPQAGITACVARKLKLKCRVYVNKHKVATPELTFARNAGAEVVISNCTFDSSAERDASTFVSRFQNVHNWTLIPFGMKCEVAVKITSMQVNKIPSGVQRFVVPVGSGITLSGVLHGMKRKGINLPVLGVIVGRDPESTLDRYAPRDWRKRCKLVRSKLPYSHRCTDIMLAGKIEVDEIYEAKCLPYLKDGDLMWIVGKRRKV